MYRKLFLAASFVFAAMTMVAQEEVSQQDTLGIHPYQKEAVCEPEITNWSLYINAGFSHFDGDNGVKLATSDQLSFEGGFGLNYQFTPLWCWYLDWHTTTYGQHMFDTKQGYDKLIQQGGRSLGHLQTIQTGIGLNLMGAFFPHRQNNLFNLYLLGGGGVAVYSYHGAGYNYSFGAKGEVTKMVEVYDAYTNGKGQWINKDDANVKKDHAAGVISGGFLAEFNVSRVFALGVRAYYDYFMNDYIDGGTSIQNKNNKNNDGLFACELEMRFNILAHSKSHMRNIANLERFDRDMEAQAAAGDGLATGAGHMKDTLVISSRDTIVSISSTSSVVKAQAPDRHFYVYFANDKDNLDDMALATIQQVAELLNNDTTLCAEISGYCDNTGNVAYNKALSQRRADNVLDEFVQEYEFSSDRAYTVSNGIVVGKRSKAGFAPNRRVDIHLIPKDKFTEMKAAHEAKIAAEKNGGITTPQEAKNIIEEKMNEVKNVVEQAVENIQEELTPAIKEIKEKTRAGVEAMSMVGDTKVVTIKEGETLSKLARREYGNTHCWIYIYEANSVRLANPSAVRPGMTVFLPSLSEQQKAITKEEADSMYQRHKAQK